jgi:hypothetical protein
VSKKDPSDAEEILRGLVAEWATCASAGPRSSELAEATDWVRSLSRWRRLGDPPPPWCPTVSSSLRRRGLRWPRLPRLRLPRSRLPRARDLRSAAAAAVVLSARGERAACSAWGESDDRLAVGDDDDDAGWWW